MCQFDVKVLNNHNESSIEIVAYWYLFKINTIAPGGKFIHKHPRRPQLAGAMVLVLKRYQYATISILLFYNYLRFWRQIGTLFCKKRIFCIKHNIWPPGVSMYGLSPMGNGINFEQLLICINFNMTFIINIQYFEGKLTHFLH